MYEYITQELPTYLKKTFPNLDVLNASLMGHSMGGHGALTIFLKNHFKYKSVSAFSPICNPINCPWGRKAFGGYLGKKEREKNASLLLFLADFCFSLLLEGPSVDAWKEYDATELARKYQGPKKEIFVDQGTSDSFLREQLLPENLKKVVDANPSLDLTLKYREGYDHSYFYIATFVEEHVLFHAKHLLNKP